MVRTDLGERGSLRDFVDAGDLGHAKSPRCVFGRASLILMDVGELLEADTAVNEPIATTLVGEQLC